ncbi:MAG: winged helix-turn-helix domain-containing protein [Proteobacteria bacterium]|nr:winged helix-turn-helix domain-containing protein [Pseudomonadota bacterium]
MNRAIHFHDFRFEPDSTRLWVGSCEVKLTPKAAMLLGALLERAGEPVSKEELFAQVWRGTVVSDDALVTCIQELRKALGDDAKQPRFIETRHRRGYRFAAPLSVVQPEVDAATAALRPAGPAIAVLPFTDMSPGRDQDYFCEGLAEELIDALTHVEGLRVVSRSASFQFRGPGVDVKEVGLLLGVDSLLEGSVRKAGNRLRITVQLIDTATAFHKWSERFDRNLDDVFAVQDEIAGQVASMLRGGDLSGRERRALRRTQTASDTYEYFLRGRQSLHRLTRPALEHSREMFRHAIEIDPEYAPAWAGLAMMHAQRFEWWGSSAGDLDEAERASRIAMELDPELADAHVARGFTLSLRREFDAAERHFEAAISINPQLFDAHYLFARSCFARGQVERSARLFGSAATVRPDDFQSAFLHSQSLRMLGRNEEARLANLESLRRAERILALNPREIRTLSLGSGALQEAGDMERARAWMQRALEIDPEDLSALFNAACLHTKAGENEQAITLLERALGLGCGKRDWIEHDPDYDPLRGDPRFQAMMARLK